MSTETETQQTPAAKPKSNIIMIGAIALGAVLGAAAGAFAIGPVVAPAPAVADATTEHDGSVVEPVLPAPTTAPTVLGNLVLNPAESRGTRFLLVSVGFEFGAPVSSEEFERRETEIRDRVLSVLGTKTVNDLVDFTRRDEYRREIAASVDSLLGAGKVRRVFFPQFVIQ